jgi:cellobiose-specific phosphotransferase system component IIA
MKQQFAPLFQSIGLSSKLGALALSNFEELMALEFDHAQELVERGTQQLKEACADRGISREASELPEAIQSGMHVFIDLTHNTMRAVTDYQVAKFRLMQNQASEVQKEISAAFKHQLTLIQTTGTADNRISKSPALAQKRAA